jgi:putative inorganic carbon (HCO3(-)) transporter
MLATARARTVWIGAGVLLALWAGLVLTLSQSSLGALLVGLATLAVLRWGARRVLLPAAAVVAVAVAAVLLTPGTFGIDLDNLDGSSSGRTVLVRGGGELFAERPLTGYGSGAFSLEYRRQEGRVAPDAATASHTIPITVAAEQGVVGLLAYLGLLTAALARLLGRGVRDSVARSAVAAAFLALLFHTLVYAAFLEDPLTWALLGVGTALAAAAAPRRAPAGAPEASPPTATERSAARRAELGTA